MELVFELLRYVENKSDSVTPELPEIGGYTQSEVSYHIKILGQSGLLKIYDFSDNNGEEWAVIHMTNKGHDFYDELKQPEILEVIKSEFKDASLSTLISIVKGLAEKIAKNKIQSLGLN